MFLKRHFQNQNIQKITYGDFKNFSEENFNQELTTSLGEKCFKNYASLWDVFLNALNKHGLLKKKVIRADHAPDVTKFLRKAIIKRLNLQKIYLRKTAWVIEKV